MSATVIRNLLAFARTANNDGEIEAYIGAHSVDVCEALGVSLDQLWRETDKGPVLKGLDRLVRSQRKRAALEARQSLDHSAAALVRASWPVGDKIVLDAALLAEAVKAPGLAYLQVTLPDSEPFCYRADKIRAVARLFKTRPINAWVDHTGVHYRWATGGLNLIPQCATDGDTRVNVVFSSRDAIAA